VIMGFAEQDGDLIHNTAVLIEPGVDNRFYRKSHLPCLGLDRFAARGEDLPIFDTALGKIGILICYDLRPPEAARTLALKGADIIVLPTNWPVGAEITADHIAIARAAESRVFVGACNRVGDENGFHFIGRSKIIAPSGQVLAAADSDREATIIAEVDLSMARQKRTVNIPGEYELEIMGCRNPKLYGILAESG